MLEISWPTIWTAPCTRLSIRYFLPVFLETAAMIRSIGTPSPLPADSAALSAAPWPALRSCALAAAHEPTRLSIKKIAQVRFIFASYGQNFISCIGANIARASAWRCGATSVMTDEDSAKDLRYASTYERMAKLLRARSVFTYMNIAREPA